MDSSTEWIQIGQWEYFIADFAKRHPGGSVIQYYFGTDATDAFREFHSNSRKADAVLASLKRRPVSKAGQANKGGSANETEQAHGLGLVPTTPPVLVTAVDRPDPMMEDFRAWRDDLKARGFFKPSYLSLSLRLLEFLMLFVAGCFALRSGSLVWGVLLFSMSNVRSGWLQHEAGHNSLTTNPKLDKLLQTVLVGFGLSTSGYQWNRMHTKHHATPQKVSHDVDLDTLPFVAFYIGQLEWGRKHLPVSKLWLYYQAYTFLPFTAGLLIQNFWIYYLHPKVAFGKDRLGFCIMLASHVIKPSMFVLFGGTSFATGYALFVLCNCVTAIYLFGHFSLSHTFTDVVPADEHPGWVRYALEHTVDIANGNVAVDWIMGYLNYQVIHHLFPSMPQFRGPAVSRELAKKAKLWDIKYTRIGYFEAWGKMFANLSTVGQHYYRLEG